MPRVKKLTVVGSRKCEEPAAYSCKKGSVILTSHLLSEFQVSEHIHSWTVNSVSSLVKDPKHITAITSPPKPDLYHLHHKQLVKNAKITHLHHKCQTTCFDVDE